ncbi:unnamed protein product [Rhizoctonia solani]|uniref:Uncharacterized protein n=1 Tax=Rhizoctonia solani TaxID=456999 RepID=A0A8H3D9R7_9AGAM|nr:unnamed protein product [Rhizoctonia solani]
MPSILSKVFHPLQARRRDEYISGSSLGSSLSVSNRLSSLPPATSWPLSLKFHKKWKAPECPVMKWYQEQSRWSTKFKSIEHRRELQAPFHHEYLLIHLDDGAICRLERMGEGTRADAIRPIGCTAHDIIQRFDKGTYNKHELSVVPSELLIQVEFPPGLDLLDVLAICFSIQQVKKSSVYTIQRYNCYFLCLTVLAVLTRRAAQWGAAVDRASWSSAVKHAIQNLETMECSDSYEYLGLGVCSLVDPHSSKPRKFVLDAIRKELCADGFSGLNKAIDDTLWHKDLGSVAQTRLSGNIGHAITRALTKTNGCTMRMRRLLDDGGALESTDASYLSDFQREFRISVMNGFARAWQTSAKSAAITLSMREVEDPTPLSRRLFLRSMAVKLFIQCILQPGDEHGLWEELKFEELPPLLTRVWVVLRLSSLICLVSRLDSEDLDNSDEDDAFDEFHEISRGHAVTAALYETIQSPLCVTPDKALVALQNSDFFDKDLWAACLAICVGRQIKGVVCQRCMSVGLVEIVNAHPKYCNTGHMTVAEFQENYIIKRIQEHAKRVAAYGLAAEKLVHDEIERTMVKVWEKMPYMGDYVELKSQSDGSGDNCEQLGSGDLVEDYALNEMFVD